MRLQTEFAYGTEPWTGYCDTSLPVAAAALRALNVSGPTLVIGGGHPKELDTLRDAGLAPLHLLTAHALEADAARPSIASATCGDVHDMPYESGTFRVVFTSNVFEHVFAPYLALMECRRVVVLDGLAYHAIPEFEGPEHGVGPFHLHCLTEPVWRELLAKTGWSVASVRRVARGDGHMYTHYLCTAIGLPPFHDRVLQAVEAARRS